MKKLLTLGLFVGCLSFSSQASAVDFSGEWEVQSMGADREITIQQNGNKIVAHRVMWPTFEGERYKLEHLYRGTINGNTITGNLLVKDEELPKFEVLRAFKAKILGSAAMDFDHLKLRKEKNKKAAPAQAAPAQAPQVAMAPPTPPTVQDAPSGDTDSSLPPPPPPPPSMAQAPRPAPAAPARTSTPKKDSDSALPPAPPAPPASPATTGAGPSSGLFGQIISTTQMGDLFALAARVNMPPKAKMMADQADIHFEKKRYKKALKAYRRAAKVVGGANIDFQYQIGRCHLELKEYGAAQRILRKVARLDPFNAPARAEYKRAATYLNKKRSR